jgi:hypothetical protein
LGNLAAVGGEHSPDLGRFTGDVGRAPGLQLRPLGPLAGQLGPCGLLTPVGFLRWRWQRATVRLEPGGQTPAEPADRMHDVRQALAAGPAARFVVDRIEQIA